ncbi:hypothetical protein FOZ61_009952, partial [Perkinsus olseni]
MPDESHKPQAAAHVEMCRELRVTKTIAIGGGVGLILPNRDQWNAAIAAVSTDTTLVVKEDVRDILMKDLASKNNVDTTRLSIVCNRDRVFLVQEPPQALKDSHRQYNVVKCEANARALPGA